MWEFISAVVSRATLSDWLLLCFGLLLVLYIVGTWNYDYFQKRGIPSTKPRIPFMGDMASMFTSGQSFVDMLKDQYKWCGKSSVFGLFEFTNPVFFVRDPELLKVIAVKDFDKFMNHRPIATENSDPIFSKNLFNTKGETWRSMRATLSPVFTSSKIKGFFPLMSQCGEQMSQHLREKYANSEEGKKMEPLPTDMKDFVTRVANDVIATIVFGVTCDSLKNPENEFYHMGKALTTFSKLRTFIFMFFMAFPKLMEALGLRVLDGKATNFFDTLVSETMRERLKKSIFRPDILHLLMQAREEHLKEEKEDAAEAENVGTKKKLTDVEISATAGAFFFAGFETVSSAICVITHLLSHHQDVQKRLQDEISMVLESTDGKITYEAVQRMKYMDAVINECLRMYPPLVATDRMCTEDTVLPAGANSVSVTVRKGQLITIPVMGLHYDPQYWDEPEEFNPERFNDENKHNIKPFTYMPFGLGPRICIGQRFAMVEVKIALVHLLSNFDLHPCAKTKDPLEFEPGFNVMVRGGFWCGLTPREIEND